MHNEHKMVELYCLNDTMVMAMLVYAIEYNITINIEQHQNINTNTHTREEVGNNDNFGT